MLLTLIVILVRVSGLYPGFLEIGYPLWVCPQNGGYVWELGLHREFTGPSGQLCSVKALQLKGSWLRVIGAAALGSRVTRDLLSTSVDLISLIDLVTSYSKIHQEQ